MLYKVTAYKYNKNDELLCTDTLNTVTEEDSVVIYKNDKNGNQLATVNRYEIPSEKKDSTYVDIDVTLGDNRLNENVVNHYNALNQLTQTLTKNYKVSFTYDAEGLRTSKTVNGEKTVFVWDGDQLVMELSEGGKVKSRYIRGNDLVYTDKGESTEKYFYVMDSHGNVVQLTDGNGTVTKTYEYDSFGNEVNPDSRDDNPFRYCGEYYDKEMGEIYLRARYYQPSVGRFLTRDTYTGEDDEPTSLHLYVYCQGNPINFVDPSGHKKSNVALVQETVWNYFIKYFNGKQVAGIMGNIEQESGWNPLCRDSGSQYWGLFQIGEELSKQLEEKYKNKGLNISEYGYDATKYRKNFKKIPRNDLSKILKYQLKFIKGCKPTSQNWIAPLKGAKSVEEAAEIFLIKFEGAATKLKNKSNKIKYYKEKDKDGNEKIMYYQEADKRRKYARSCYNKYNNKELTLKSKK